MTAFRTCRDRLKRVLIFHFKMSGIFRCFEANRAQIKQEKKLQKQYEAKSVNH